MKQSFPKRIPFAKLSASANDFIVIDNRNGQYSEMAADLARRLCKRRYSIGADGLILIENAQSASFRVRFYNPDGNEFNTCGNGGRAAARFAALSSIAPPDMTIQTNVGVIDAHMVDTGIRLKMVAPTKIQLNFSLDLDGQKYHGHIVHVGDPHFVVYSRNIRELDFVPLARLIRHHEALGPEGANVHFIEPVSRQRIKIRSFERGVEDETFACGSGCVSTAVSTFQNKDSDPPITFEPQSGIPLIVDFRPGNDFQDIYLQGDARLVYQSEITEEAMTGFPVE